MMKINDKIKTGKIPVNELYTAIQAEGSRTGRPTIVVRVSGCGHRCWFGEGGWCDAWNSSIHPEKSKFDFQDILDIYDRNPQIKEMMLTGGSPTMFPEFVNQITNFCYLNDIFLTMETEGGAFFETDYKIDLVSISPKFSNSVPKLGILTPLGKEVDQKFIDQHNKFRLKHDIIQQLINFHSDYHYKPVWDGTDDGLKEIEEFRVRLNIPKSKTFLMPAGDNRSTLIKMYPITMEKCIEVGYNWTGRPHIIGYDTLRYV